MSTNQDADLIAELRIRVGFIVAGVYMDGCLAGSSDKPTFYDGTDAAKEIHAAYEAYIERLSTPLEERCESCRVVLIDGSWKYDSAGEVKLCNVCYRVSEKA